MVFDHQSGSPRIGAVRYLNSKPLIENLSQFAPYSDLILDYPSRLADRLAEGELDIALIPSVEYFNHPDYEILSDACVASRGPVLSVKLYSRVPIGEIQTLALDEGSRTSATLVRVILAEQYGVQPKLVPLPIQESITTTSADAILVIGDRAIHPTEEQFHETWDLGEKWLKWTGLPFVFAMWVTRKGVETGTVGAALENARDLGEKSIPAIAKREADSIGISVETAERYLTNNLHFRLGSAERNGLRLFSELAFQLKFIPHGHSLNFRNTNSEHTHTSHCG